MFCCLKCGELAFLVRGLCRKCAPKLHQNWTYAGEGAHQGPVSFQPETGKPALLYWGEAPIDEMRRALKVGLPVYRPIDEERP